MGCLRGTLANFMPSMLSLGLLAFVSHTLLYCCCNSWLIDVTLILLSCFGYTRRDLHLSNHPSRFCVLPIFGPKLKMITHLCINLVQTVRSRREKVNSVLFSNIGHL